MTATAREERALRPYRRFVAFFFVALVTAVTGLTLRGIIRHLDRLPSRPDAASAVVLDARALRACTDDLELLERATRQEAGRALARSVNAQEAMDLVDAWRRRLADIKHRCRLDDSSGTASGATAAAAAAHQSLVRSAELIDDLVRELGLLLERHVATTGPTARAAQQSLRQALRALKTGNR